MALPEKWITPLARAGYFSRGIVYSTIGFFGILAAFGSSENKDTKGALQELFAQPAGNLLVAFLIVGLVGYAIWRFIQSIFDTDDHGWSPKGLIVRRGLLGSAFAYAALAMYSASMAGWLESFTGGGGGGSPRLAGYISGIVAQRWVAWGMAAIFLIACLAHYWKALTAKFAEHFVADKGAMIWISPVAYIGLIARGTVFLILSFLLAFRGISASSGGDTTPDIKTAMEFVQGLPFGHWMLAAMGVGILLFAGYSFCEAFWRRINIEDAHLPDAADFDAEKSFY